MKLKNKELKESSIKVNQNNQVPIKLYDKDIEDVIIEAKRGAKNEICIAMAYFTSNTLMDELYRARENRVSIKLK